MVKFFEGLRPCTRNIAAVLTHLFEAVSIIKPTATTHQLERYLVCRQRNDTDPLWAIDPFAITTATVWNEEYAEIVKRLAQDQLRHLTRAVESV